MAKKASPTDLSPTEFHDRTSSSEDQQKSSTKRRAKKDSIKSYVSDVLTKQVSNNGQPTDLTQSEFKINTKPPDYQNVSAFRRYQSNAEGATRTNAQRQNGHSSSSDEELRGQTPTTNSANLDGSATELNLDPDPLYEERESAEQIYKQKVYLRQLQPPTPQPLEIQVQEVLIKPQVQQPPIHVRVGQREPRTPSPIIIKTAPPQPPPPESDQPIIYNKYVPPPKQLPQQIIIHRYPDLPPKPRPIVVEQWLPYKPAPKRIIKHSLPPEAYQAQAAPRNLIIAYTKPRAVIEVELVRLPIVRIDPQMYQQLSAGGQQQLIQHPTFRHEQDYISRNRSPNTSYDSKPINWRI